MYCTGVNLRAKLLVEIVVRVDTIIAGGALPTEPAILRNAGTRTFLKNYALSKRFQFLHAIIILCLRNMKMNFWKF